MQLPGLSRAIPMGILGFLSGALLVIIMRALQSMESLWDPGVGIVFGTLFSAGFFVWGMGAFDPKMNLHGEEAEQQLERIASNEPPQKMLFGSVWQIATLTLIGFIVLMAFALLSGLRLVTTEDPLASLTEVGYFEVEAFGQTLQVSELVVFVIFLIVMFLSLAAVAGALAWLLTFLNRGIKETQAIPIAAKPAPALAAAAVAGALPSGEAAVEAAAPVSKEPRFLPNMTPKMILPSTKNRKGLIGWLLWLIGIPVKVLYAFLRPNKDKPTAFDWIKSLVIFGVLLVVLYLFFYYVAIGLIFPTLPGLELISFINALLVALLIIRPKYVIQINALIAALVARILRAIPGFLQ